MDYSNGAFDGDSDGMLEGSELAVTLGYTDGKALGSAEGILPGSALAEVIGYTLGAADGTELNSSYGSFDVSNDCKHVDVLLG